MTEVPVSENQCTDFYMIGNSIMKELKDVSLENILHAVDIP